MARLVKYIAGQFRHPKGLGGVLSTWVMNIMNRRQYRAVIDSISPKAQGAYLDIGFGNGYLIRKLARRYVGRFYGVELSGYMLARASKRSRHLIQHGRISLQLGDVDALPFADGYFDYVYTVNTLYFWDNIDQGLQEVKRVMKPDGQFVCVLYSKQWLDGLVYTRYGFSKFDNDELKTIFERNGLSITRLTTMQGQRSLCVVATV